MKRLVVILCMFMAFSAFPIVASADASVASELDIIGACESESDGVDHSLTEENESVSSDTDRNNTASDTASRETQESTPADENAESESNPTDGDIEEENASVNEEEEKNDVATDTVFSMLYELTMEYATEILSALAALLSCLLAFGYKKGLIPFLRQGIGVISGTVSKLGESTESANRIVTEQSEATRQMTAQITAAVSALSESMLALGERLTKLEEASAERAGIREALIGEIDMLAEIFLASSLPEYRKEKIGTTVARLKEQLSMENGE